MSAWPTDNGNLLYMCANSLAVCSLSMFGCHKHFSRFNLFYRFNVIKDCWKRDPKNRPSFADLNPVLHTLLSRASFTRELIAIDQKLQAGDLNLTVGAPKSPVVRAKADGRSKSPATPIPTLAREGKVETETHTDEGYLKVIDSKSEEGFIEEYDYVSATPKKEETETAINLEESYDYISPALQQEPQTVVELAVAGGPEEEYDYISPASNQQETEKVASPPVNTSPTVYIHWGDDDNGYVDVTPNPSPQMPIKAHSSLTNLQSGNKGMKHSKSSSDVNSQEQSELSPEAAKSKESPYYNFGPNVPKGEGDNFLSLPRSPKTKQKPVPSPKPRVNADTLGQRCDSDTRAVTKKTHH